MNADDVKKLLNISLEDAKNDDYYNAMIPVLFEIAKEYEKGDYTIDNLPARVKLFIAKGCYYLAVHGTETRAISNKKKGDISVSYESATESMGAMGLPQSIIKLLRKKCVVSFV